MLICITFYVILSLIEMRKPYDLDRMLHRGKYDITGSHKKADDAVKSTWWKFVGITQEFTRVDRILAVSFVVWNSGWLAVFIIVTIINFMVKPISLDWWSGFWKFWLWLYICVSIITMFWFVTGGVRDLRFLFARLRTLKRDDRDDGRIVGHHLAAEEDTIVAKDDAAKEEQTQSD